MRNFFTLSVLGMMLVSSLQAQSWDWAEEIARLNPEIIDSVKTIGLGDEVRWTQSCMIYYHQPLQHDNPSLGTLPLRAVFTAYTFGDFKGCRLFCALRGAYLDGHERYASTGSMHD